MCLDGDRRNSALVDCLAWTIFVNVCGRHCVDCHLLSVNGHAALGIGALQKGGWGVGGMEVCNFLQFSAVSQFFEIFRNFPRFSTIAFGLSTLCACWCPLNCCNELQCFPAPKIIKWFLPVPQGHAAMWV